MAKTSKSCWKGFESWIASFWNTRRTPLSGENSGHGGGDIILRGYDALVEAKVRARFEHHTIFRKAQADAKKHGVNPHNVFLYTRKKHEREPLVVMEASTFHERVLPLLQPLLKKEAQSNEVPRDPTPSSCAGGPGTRVYTEDGPPPSGPYARLSEALRGIPNTPEVGPRRRRGSKLV